MKRIFESEYDRLLRKHKRLKIALLSTIGALLAILGLVLYANYDYIVFRTLIARNYIHTDALDEMFDANLGFVPENHARYFDNLVISIVTREIRFFGSDPYTFQYSPAANIARQERAQTVARQSYIEEIAPGIGILHIANFSPYARNFVDDNIDVISSFDNLILDLRGNLGGDLAAMRSIASHFLDSRATVSHERARIDFFSNEIRAYRGGRMDFDNIIILQNERTASASESLIMALKENLDNVTTIGTQTFGKGIGQIRLPLRRGFAVRATVILMEGPSGGTIHGEGITPDIEYFGEDIRDFALARLKEEL